MHRLLLCGVTITAVRTPSWPAHAKACGRLLLSCFTHTLRPWSSPRWLFPFSFWGHPKTCHRRHIRSATAIIVGGGASPLPLCFNLLPRWVHGELLTALLVSVLTLPWRGVIFATALPDGPSLGHYGRNYALPTPYSFAWCLGEVRRGLGWVGRVCAVVEVTPLFHRPWPWSACVGPGWSWASHLLLLGQGVGRRVGAVG
jgi:hypothetical protein